MIIPFDMVDPWFGARIRYEAKKASIVGLDPEDSVQDLTISVSQEDFTPKPTRCYFLKRVLPVDPAHVNLFLKHRSKDLIRKELRRRRRSKTVPVTVDDIQLMAVDLPSPTFEFRESLDAFNRMLGADDARVVYHRAFLPATVLAAANRDHQEALRDRARGALRMNVHKVVVLDKHVAEALDVSPATVSRALRRARVAYSSQGGLP